MSIDDLYNNFKIVEQSVKKSVGASSGAQNLAFMTAPSTSSTNDVNTVIHAYEFSTASPNVNTTSPQQDLEQIHEDDLEAMDLKWQLSLLSMRAKRYYQRTCKKIFINANDTAGYDKSKVECFNYHKMGHFAKECRAPRNKEGQFRNQDNTRKQGNNEDTSSKAMLAIDGVGFDWSDMAEEQVQTNMALMAFSDSEVYNDKTCSKTCLKNYETLKKQCDDLIVKLNQTEFTAATYKRGLATVEEQLITYRKNEVLFSEEVAVLKREVACKDYEINVLKSEFEKVKQEKEGIEFKIEKFDKASKDLDKLLESQITDKSKKGLGYSVVPPPHPLIYNRPKKLDLSYSGLDEFKEPEFKGYGSEDSKKESNVVCDKKSDDSKENSDNSLVKEQVSKDTSSFVESSLNVDKETVFPVDKKVESVKPKNHEKPVKKSVRYAEMYRSQTPRGNQRNWNGQKSNQLGSDFVMYNKACFICGSFNHVQAQCKYHQRERMRLLMKTGLKPFNTARTVNTAHPKSIVFSAKPMSCFPKIAQSTVRRPFQSKIALSNKRFTHKVNTAKAQAVNTARPQAVNTGRPKAVKTARPNYAVVNAIRVNQENVVKASACWGKPQQDDTGFVDSGCSRHMTVNIAYLSNFKEFDGGSVTFGKDNINSFDMKNIVHKESLTCLVAKATLDESMLWHRRLGHINFKNINKLVKDNLVRGLPTKCFENDQTCVACPSFLEKGIRREYSVARTPQQNGMAERRNKTLIEANRTMLADSKLPTTFWAEVVITACYVQNRVLVVKPHNKTPYELFRGFKPALSFMKPFGCHVTILNTLDNLGKFDGKSDEGFFVGYFLSSKAFRVYNTRTRRVEENLHIRFLENKPMIERNGPKWLFDIDSLTQSINYVPVAAGTIINESADSSYFDSPFKDVDIGEPKSAVDDQKQVEDGLDNENDEKDKSDVDCSPKEVNAARQHVNTTSLDVNTGSFKLNTIDPSVNTANSYDQDSHKDMFTMGASHTLEATHVEFFSDEDAPEVWILMDLHIGKRGIGIKWFFKNKKDKRGIVIRNKARVIDKKKVLTVNKSFFFAPVARIEAIRLFLAYASFMGFLVYQMDVKSAFLYGTIEEKVYVTQPLGSFKDLTRQTKFTRWSALYGLHQATKSHVYVDDIIFGSTNKELCTGFEKLTKDNQEKYVAEILKKFNYTDVKSASTSVDLKKPLVKDGDADDVDVHLYRSMIGSLMYLTASSPDIIYLKGKPTLGLWYSRDSPFELVAYTDSDYAGATQDRKSTTGGCQFLGNRLISWQCKKQTVVATSTTEAKYVAAASCCRQVGDEAVHKELGGRMERAATTASSLEVE
ncbi:putative ribonuclease H-like domain-containing protein [Tanacetum coccineum]